MVRDALSILLILILEDCFGPCQLKSPLSHLVASFQTPSLDPCIALERIQIVPETFLLLSPVFWDSSVFSQDQVSQILKRNFTSRFVHPPSRFFLRCPVVLLELLELEAPFKPGDDADSVDCSHLEIFQDTSMGTQFLFLFRGKFMEKDMDLLSLYAKHTRALFNTFFLLQRDLEEMEIFTPHGVSRVLEKLEISRKAPWARSNYMDFQTSQFNFDGHPFVTLVCPVCATPVEEFQGTKKKPDPVVQFMYEITLRINATLELVPIFKDFADENYANGVWDDWVAPLMDGSAVISSLIKPSHLHTKVLYVTKYVGLHKVSFVTAKPKKLRFKTLAALLTPFSWGMWVMTFISVLAVTVVLEFILHFKLNSSPLERWHSHWYTLQAMLAPMVDQNGLSSPRFHRSIQSVMSRGVVGLWFFFVIGLGCAYKSKMTVMLVMPTYVQPPATFQELADSKYHIGFLLYPVVEPYLKKNYRTYGKGIMERAQEQYFMDPDCYQQIFEKESACVGMKAILEALGKKFMIDVRRQEMFKWAKESIFPIVVGSGTSKLYPSVLEVVDTMSNWFESFAIPRYWQDLMKLEGLLEGQDIAVKSVDSKPFYRGQEEEDQEDKSSGKIIILFLSLFRLLIFIACIVFTVEFVLSKTTRLYRETFRDYWKTWRNETELLGTPEMLALSDSSRQSRYPHLSGVRITPTNVEPDSYYYDYIK